MGIKTMFGRKRNGKHEDVDMNYVSLGVKPGKNTPQVLRNEIEKELGNLDKEIKDTEEMLKKNKMQFGTEGAAANVKYARELFKPQKGVLTEAKNVLDKIISQASTEDIKAAKDRLETAKEKNPDFVKASIVPCNKSRTATLVKKVEDMADSVLQKGQYHAPNALTHR